MAEIALADVTKIYSGGLVALDHLTLTIGHGEIFGLVGPSGCGKTTALRVIAGLEKPSSGRIWADGRDITGTETRQRGLGLITQANHLVNHLDVSNNIGFPVRIRRAAHSEVVDAQVRAEAADLRLEHLLHRKPKTLSEGERRAVQLARAVIAGPQTLLMDEPLAHLEDQIRRRLRADIIEIHHRRGLTSILVTANQEDAMVMCDRVAVLFDGMVHQVAEPIDIYRQPATAAVAGFFGEPSMNLLEGRVERDGAIRRLEVLGRPIPMWSPLLDDYRGGTVIVGIRGEDLRLGVRAEDALEARVVAVEPQGHKAVVQAVVGDATELRLLLPGRPPPVGSVLDVGIPGDRVHLFDPGTGLAILHPATP